MESCQETRPRRATVARMNPAFADVSAVAFAPRGDVLAVGRYTGEVQLVAVGSGAPIGRPLAEPSDTPGLITIALAFSARGNDLLVARSPVVSRLTTRFRVRGPTKRACSVARRSFSRSEWQHEIGVLPYEKTCG